MDDEGSWDALVFKQSCSPAGVDRTQPQIALFSALPH